MAMIRMQICWWYWSREVFRRRSNISPTRVAGGKGGTEQWWGSHHWRLCQSHPLIVLRKECDRAWTMTQILGMPCGDLKLMTSRTCVVCGVIGMHACHGPCSVTFFSKNNQRTALTESLMMATSPLFSATFTTGHPRWTYIEPPSEYFPTPIPPTNLHSYHCHYQPAPCATLPQHNQSPTMLHTCSMSQANHIAHAPLLEVMCFGRHKDLWGFESASFGTLRSTSLFIICPLYYHILSKLTPYMFMFPLCINTLVCCMYFASSNINLATYFS